MGKDLDFLDAPISYVGTRYSPVSHRIVVESIMEGLEKSSYTIKNERNIVKANGQKAIGLITLDAIDSELDMLVAWRNSLDGSMSFAIEAGTSVVICSNMNIFSGEHIYKRKHTGEAQSEILEGLTRTLQDIEDVAKEHVQIRERMKQIELDLHRKCSIAGEMFIDKNLLNPTQMNELRRQIQNPEHIYGAKDSLWEFYNHCTYALKNNHPQNYQQIHASVGEFLVKVMETEEGFLDIMKNFKI